MITKILPLFILSTLAYAGSANASFLSFTLYEQNYTDANEVSTLGDLQATLGFNGLGTASWSVTLDNQSELYINTNSQYTYTSPGIKAFGFDVDPTIAISGVQWTLTAYNSINQLVILGSSDENAVVVTDGTWQLTDSLSSGNGNGNGNGNSFNFDFVPNTTNGSNGALYNVDHRDDILLSEFNVKTGGTDFFTTATLTINFNGIATNLFTPYNVGVRFQNVGENGEASAKLITDTANPPDDDDGGSGSETPTVPEPTSVLLLLVGAIGMAGFGYRRRKLELSA